MTAGAARGRANLARMSTPIEGWVAPGFELVRDAFAANFAERGEVGAGVHVVVRGEVVVDLVGGWRDAARTEPWRPDTLVNVYSVGKALLALLALQLVDVGELGLDQPVAELWPEFAEGGKATATVAHALTHRAGVPAIRQRLTDEDLFHWDRMTAALAATEAWFPPGERIAYHTNTFGHLVGEIVRRASGQMPGERLRAVAEPLGADVWFGVPEDEHHCCAGGQAHDRPAPDPATVDGLEGEQPSTPSPTSTRPATPRWAWSTRRRGARCRWGPPRGTPRPRGSPACTRRCWSPAGCCRPPCWRTPPGHRPSGTARSSARR